MPVQHSSHPRLSIRCSKSSSHFCGCCSLLPLLLQPTLYFSLSLFLWCALSLSLSLSGFPVAHAVETLYLIHYNTSPLTPSQMGGWLMLALVIELRVCLTGSCVLPQLLLPHSLFSSLSRLYTFTRPGLYSFPHQCREKASSLRQTSTLLAVAYSSPNSKVPPPTPLFSICLHFCVFSLCLHSLTFAT